MTGLKLYSYKSCDTCRRARRWLIERSLQHTELPIRETPPSFAELQTMLEAQGGEIKRVCNVSGREYRTQVKAGELLADESADYILSRLAADGRLVKRPFLIGRGQDGRAIALVGFDAAQWRATLGV